MLTRRSFRSANLSAQGTVHEWLLLSSGFSCLLLAIRMLATQTIEYIFLPWNLFLAFVPYWISLWLAKNKSIIENRKKLLVTLIAWLLFIPNSFYIITDLFHFTRVRSAPKWFDLLLIFSFAWNGILCGIVSIRRIEIITGLSERRRFSFLLIFIVMWLNAFGIYIGRFLRFNSWDVIANPFSLGEEMIDMLIHPFHKSHAWGMTFCYAIFMTFLYFTVKKLSETFTDLK
ncbi:MAG: DUF1361 domain-containing protein [Chitinophagaceae bacterium]